MNRQDLKNTNGIKIGYIDTGTDGRQSVFDTNGFKYGYYDPKSNKTYNNNGSIISYGNTLITLLPKK